MNLTRMDIIFQLVELGDVGVLELTHGLYFSLELLGEARVTELEGTMLPRNLVYPFIYIASAATPDTFVYLIHIILSGTICAHF